MSVCFVLKSRDKNHLSASLVPLHNAKSSLASVGRISEIYLQCDYQLEALDEKRFNMLCNKES